MPNGNGTCSQPLPRFNTSTAERANQTRRRKVTINFPINRSIRACAIALLLSCAFSAPAAAQLQLQSDTALSTAGYFRLSWQQEQRTGYQLQQARNSDFSDAHDIYRGEDSATVISGLADGHYFYRVRNPSANGWSETVEVEVKHHPLSRAFGFFALGAVMFVATLVVLLKGARSTRRP